MNNESDEYISYLENELKSIREFLDGYNQYNSGSVYDDVVKLFEVMYDE